jgi:hypothetical protein
MDLEDYRTDQLEAELRERRMRHAAGVCSYCKRDHGRLPACKFPKRHSGQEI